MQYIAIIVVCRGIARCLPTPTLNIYCIYNCYRLTLAMTILHSAEPMRGCQELHSPPAEDSDPSLKIQCYPVRRKRNTVKILMINIFTEA